MKRLITKKASNGNELLTAFDTVINTPKFKNYIINKASEFAREELESDFENTTESEVLENFYKKITDDIDDIIEYFIDELSEVVEDTADVQDGDLFYNASNSNKELAAEKIFETLHVEIETAIETEKEELEDMYNNR